jgi:polyhydroxybutyrate depolymerase
LINPIGDKILVKDSFKLRPWHWQFGIPTTLIAVVVLAYAFLFIVAHQGRESIVVGTIERTYLVHLPPQYDGKKPMAVVLAFHPLSGNGRTMEWISELDRVADQNGFVVVYPDGYKSSWADGSGRYDADRDGINDVSFVSALITQLTNRLAIDSTRIYATGFSNGGYLAQRLACELPEKLAAVATVGAALAENVYGKCTPAIPVPMLMIAGTSDASVPWAGKERLATVPATVAKWVAVNGCATKLPVSYVPLPSKDGLPVRREAYAGCQNDGEVLLYAVEGGSNKWYGGNDLLQFSLPGSAGKDLDASSVILDFFKNHKR